MRVGRGAHQRGSRRGRRRRRPGRRCGCWSGWPAGQQWRIRWWRSLQEGRQGVQLGLMGSHRLQKARVNKPQSVGQGRGASTAAGVLASVWHCCCRGSGASAHRICSPVRVLTWKREALASAMSLQGTAWAVAQGREGGRRAVGGSLHMWTWLGDRRPGFTTPSGSNAGRNELT